MVKYKPRAGVGAKATVLTRMIYPRREVEDKKHKSTIVLIAEESRKINRKDQPCYTFTIQDEPDAFHYAIVRYVHVHEEGEEAQVFDKSFPGPPEVDHSLEKKLKWRKSRAKQILYGFLMDGTVPAEEKDANGNITMSLEDIYMLDIEFSYYDFDKFHDRLKRLRAKIVELDNRADDDLEAFKNYKKSHEPSLFSHKGYVQWQGSTAQEFLWEDLPAYLKDPNSKPKDLWLSRTEYRDEFPLDAFRDKIKQEIRTDKYIRTRQARSRGENV
jgi:hypothetical protein